MSTLDHRPDPDPQTRRSALSAANGWMGNAFKSWMPTGLYAPAPLLIMIVPMVILQTRGGVRVHGAGTGNTVGRGRFVGGRGAGHRQPDRRLQVLSAGQGTAASAQANSGQRLATGRRFSFPAGDHCRRPAPNRSSRCSTRRCRCSSAARSAGRSGSIPSAIPTWLKSASSSTIP